MNSSSSMSAHAAITDKGQGALTDKPFPARSRRVAVLWLHIRCERHARA